MSGLLAVIGAGSPLGAQGSATEAGFAVVSFPEEDDRFIVGPFLRASHGRSRGPLRWSADGMAVVTVGAASGSGSASAAWSGGRGRGGWEVDGEAATVFGTSARTGHSTIAGVRAFRLLGSGGGAWLRGTGHLAWREAGLLRGRGVESGGWMSGAGLTATATLQHQWAQGQLFASAARDRVLEVLPVRFTQGTVGVTARPRFGELLAVLGARHDRDALQRVEPLWHVDASLVTPRPGMSVAIRVARQPPDFVHGADGSFGLSIGLRFGPASRIPVRHTARGVAAGAVVALDDAGHLRVSAPAAARVEVMASFTEWETVSLTPAGGSFRLPVALAAGAHRLLLRIDGGAWHPPRNLPSIDDDFGGRVGLLVVP